MGNKLISEAITPSIGIKHHHVQNISLVDQYTYPKTKCGNDETCNFNDNDKPDIKIAAWNIHGLNQDKLSDVLLGPFLKTFDIICLTETWSEPNQSFNIENYEYFSFARQYKHSRAWRPAGGQGIFVHKRIKEGVELVKNCDDIIVWITLKRSFFNILNDVAIGSIYIYPEGSLCTDEDQFDIIQRDLWNLPSDVDYLLIGDTNSRTNLEVDWIEEMNGNDGPLSNLVDNNPYNQESVFNYLKERDMFDRKSLDRRPINKHGSSLINLCKTNNLFILNGRFNIQDLGFHSRIDTTGSSLVDLVLTTPNTHKLINDFKIGQKYPESDHLPVLLSLKLNPKTSEIKCASVNWAPMFKFIWQKPDLERLKQILGDYDSQNAKIPFNNAMVDLHNVNFVTEAFINYFMQACKRTCSWKKAQPRIKNKPHWFDTECKDKRKEVISLNRDISNHEGRHNITSMCKQYRALKQKKKRYYQKIRSEELESAYKTDRTQMWRLLSKLSNNKHIANGPSGEQLVEYYKNLAEEPVHETFNDDYRDDVIDFLKRYDTERENITLPRNKLELEILNSNITTEEIYSAIDSLKNNKSCGIDAIPCEFIKACKDSLVPDLTLLFNYFIEKEFFPDQWTEGIRTSIHKGGAFSIPSNYRGITVLPTFEKLFEIVIQKRLEFINEAFARKDNYNGGFIKNSQTSDNLFILQTLIERQLSLNQNLIICFIDFSRAFDLMNRHILFYKLIKSGLHGKVINTLRNLYTKTFFRVNHKGKLSEKIMQEVGVNQGGNASPMIFRKYLIDLKDYMKSHSGVILSEDEILIHLLWADDCITAATNVPHAQIQLNGLANFCSKNRALVNTIKTKFMAFGNLEDIKLYFNGNELERVNQYKYLGNVVRSVDRPISDIFLDNYKYLCDKARKNVYSVIKKTKQLHPISPALRIHLFETVITPVLTYGGAIWGVRKKGREQVDKIHLWYLRMILGVKSTTSNLITLGECASLPPSVRIIAQSLSYFKRLQHTTSSTSLLGKAFNENKRLSEIGFDNWYSRLLKLANDFNIDIDLNYTNKEISHLVKIEYVNRWKNDINDIKRHPKLRTYNFIKSDFRIEPYLTKVKNTKYRKAISKLRASSHILEIERGRYTKPPTPKEQRLCILCNTMETEIHFLTECSLYGDERDLLYSEIIRRFPDFERLDSYCKFNFMLCFSDERLLSSVGKFIYRSFERRKTLDQLDI